MLAASYRERLVVNGPCLFIALSLAAPLVLSGCPSGYNKAVKSDTPAAYRAFLRDNPNDSEAQAAEERLEELEFQAAQKAHTILAYKRFLDEFPKSEDAPTARALLETLRWNAALAQGTAEDFRRFLHEHPDGAHHVEAESRLRRLEAESRAQETEPDRLKDALASAPDEERPGLTARIDDLSFAAALKHGSGGLLQYLADFQSGVHREEAQRLLLSRKLDGLLFSGLLEQAQAERRRSPLGDKIADWQARWGKAQAERAAVRAPSPWVPPTLPDYYLRSVPELVHGLNASDPLERWQAAEELSAQVNVEVIDPLLDSLHTSKNPRVRQTAFESLLNLVHSLPPEVAEHELATRLVARRAMTSSPELHAQLGALLELLGSTDEAASEYQKGFDPKLPDPVVLWRWMVIRQAQHKPFSAAVAARQIGLWAREMLDELGPETQGGHLSLAGVRQLCAVAHLVRVAHTSLEASRKEEKEFPEDVAAFLRESVELRRLAEARLKDAELTLLTQQPMARTCEDRDVTVRLEDAVRLRAQALRQLAQKLPRWAPALLARARDKDPSPYIRQLAASAIVHAAP
jgi:hypothetical protein